VKEPIEPNQTRMAASCRASSRSAPCRKRQVTTHRDLCPSVSVGDVFFKLMAIGGDGSTRLSMELPHGRDSSAAERVAIENQTLLVAPAADGANLSSSMQVRRLIGKVARR